MDIKTETKKGAQVILTIEKGEILAELMAPHIQFRPTGWKTIKGITGVCGHGYYNKKTANICLTIPKETWDKAEEEKVQQVTDYTEKAMALKIIGFEYRLGCDTANTYTLIYEDTDIPWDFSYKRIKADSPIIESLKLLPLGDIAKDLGAESMEATISTYGGYTFNAEQIDNLLSLAIKAKNEVNAKRQAAKDKEENHKAAIFVKAKETNERQVLDSWITSKCTSREDIDCSFDNATTYALPDGTTKTEYIHCY